MAAPGGGIQRHKSSQVDKLLSALGAEGLTVRDVNSAASRMLYSLSNQRYQEWEETIHSPLKIANAIFVDKKQTLKSDFAQTFMDCYRGQAIAVDF